jgi:hypothetical protein
LFTDRVICITKIDQSMAEKIGLERSSRMLHVVAAALARAVAGGYKPAPGQFGARDDS